MRILKLGDKATSLFTLVIFIGVFVLCTRFLILADKFHTGLLYIAIPFALSLALYYLTPFTDGTTWKKRFWNNLRTTMIIMFAASLILMEGYVCMVMFLPIFFFITFVAFISCYIWHRCKKDSINAYALPIIVMLLSLEGVTDATTLNRYNEVIYTQMIEADVDTIRKTISQPIKLEGDRHWILSIFPMPNYIGTVSLNEGVIRQYNFVYHRWFVTNTHRGSLNVKFSEVSDNHIKTTIEDSSYIANYMRLHGTEFSFEPISDTQTKVTLTITFDRILDPIWYFEPLERFAVKKGAEYFVNEILGKQPSTKQEHI